MAPSPPLRRHASCIGWFGRGVLFTGLSGAGKSGLALRCIAAGAFLIADDLVLLDRRGGRVTAAPVALPGLLEVRGLGIVRLPFQPGACLRLVVDLAPGVDAERLPELAPELIMGVALPRLALDPRLPDAVARVQLALWAGCSVDVPCPAA